ncbi:ATP-grasp fold amidoligase family protein [Mycolicibacterium monacense]|nr:ATP-grasp fold amidoligase family protein [Mycolicibacterium monacense]ORB22145.1 hypothetical protein BST34_08540 [Mycolicibacterium monacense DSM 44395]
MLSGIGVRTPAIRWIVVKDAAISPVGERISSEALVNKLLSGRSFVKPNENEGGHGAFLLHDGLTTDAKGDSCPTDASQLLELLRRGGFLIQDVIEQSEDYAAFAPSSLNTIRCLTYRSRGGSAQIAAATLRMGSGRSVVDNASSGGIFCGIDIDTHRLIGPAADLNGGLFDRHPVSGLTLQAMPLARLDEAFDTCVFAHEALGGMMSTAPATVGWDVGMTDDGPCVVEGNDLWMAALHSRADPRARQRLLTCFVRDFHVAGKGFSNDLPRISKSDSATVVFRAKGKVQRVGFRQWVARLARMKDLAHAITNLPSGDVEITLTGPLRTLEFAIAAAMHGPARADVSEIEVCSLRATPAGDGSVVGLSRHPGGRDRMAKPDSDDLSQPEALMQSRETAASSGGVGVGSCGSGLGRGDIDAGIALGGRYLLAAQRAGGDFLYEVDWVSGAESPDDSAVCQAGATWGMALLYRETGDLAYRAALDRSLARWLAEARVGEGRQWLGQGGARSGRLGSVALVGLALLECLSGPTGSADPTVAREALGALCAFVEDARLPGGGFRGAFDPESGVHSGSADPYSSGEALLLLARTGLELGVPDRVTRVLGWAEEDYDMFVAKPLAAEPDPALTKGYFQWSAMSWFALADAGFAPEVWGRRLVEQALWMVDVHRTLTRTRNTGYAYEGIVPAWEWARRTGDDDTARRLACVIHQGLRKLCSWQLGHPLAPATLRAAPERFHGAVQNHRSEPALRIDVTQHQLHALILARRYGIDTAEHSCTQKPVPVSAQKVTGSAEPTLAEQISEIRSMRTDYDARLKSLLRKSLTPRSIRTGGADRLAELDELVSLADPRHLSHYMMWIIERNSLSSRTGLSFAARMIQQSEARLLGVPQPTWLLDRKDVGYRFIDRLKVRRPLSTEPGPIHRLRPTYPCCVKPVNSTGRRGVFLVFAEDDIYSVREGITLGSWDEMVAHAATLRSTRGAPLTNLPWIAEELVLEDTATRRPARDLKFYAFYGEVLFVLEVRRQPNLEACYWSRDGQPLRVTWDDYRFDGEGVTPDQVALVEQISREIPAPFVRIDMLRGERELFFGEFTPRDGNFETYPPEWDRRMGEAWVRAEGRILTDVMAGKRFEAFQPAWSEQRLGDGRPPGAR